MSLFKSQLTQFYSHKYNITDSKRHLKKNPCLFSVASIALEFNCYFVFISVIKKINGK